jgi:ubiquinone/menaquinone biosynthesis C-methylase UbiE
MKTNNLLLKFLAVVPLILTISFPNSLAQDEWETHHNAYQPPEKVMDLMGVKKGMTIAEVGAGRGRYAVHMAKRVGETGIIYANDIDKESLDYLKKRCKRDKIRNVETILGKETNPLFPENKIDIVYFINTYHHIENKIELLKNIIPALKPDGRLIIIEHDPEKVKKLGWDSHSLETHTTAKDKVITQGRAAGYKLLKVESPDFLERDNLYFFVPETK